MPQQSKYAFIMVLHKKKDQTECGNYRGISLVAHAGKILLKIIARRFSEYCEGVGILPDPTEPFYHRYDVCDLSATGIGTEEKNSVICKFYQSVQLRCPNPPLDSNPPFRRATEYDLIRQFHDGMRACERLDGRVCSGWFAVEQGLRQECVLMPLLFSTFIAAVINVAYTRFKADKNNSWTFSFT